MTEEEWLEGTTPHPLLMFLRRWATNRKLRLFAVACCRRIWHLLEVGPSRDAVIIAEQYVDRKCSHKDLEVANRNALGQVEPVPCTDGYWTDPACLVTHEDPWDALQDLEYNVSYQMRNACQENHIEHCRLIRDIFGNPFRTAQLDPRWLTSTVIDLAGTIYEERAFEWMPILADALMDAGCDNEEILRHCRGPGPHARGCFLIDLLLGKK